MEAGDEVVEVEVAGEVAGDGAALGGVDEGGVGVVAEVAEEGGEEDGLVLAVAELALADGGEGVGLVGVAAHEAAEVADFVLGVAEGGHDALAVAGEAADFLGDGAEGGGELAGGDAVEGIGPAGEGFPVGVVGELEGGSAEVGGGGGGVAVVDGCVFLFPGEFLEAVLFGEDGLLAGVEELVAEVPPGGVPEDAAAETGDGDAVGEVVEGAEVAAEDGVGAGDGVGVFEDVADADVLEDEEGGVGAVVELLFVAFFLLDEAGAGGGEAVDGLTGAVDDEFVEVEGLVGGVEVDVDLGVVLEAGGGEEAVGVVVVGLLLFGVGLVVGEEIPDAAAGLVGGEGDGGVESRGVGPGGGGGLVDAGGGGGILAGGEGGEEEEEEER